jgi:NAD-dependent DNA ligase
MSEDELRGIKVKGIGSKTLEKIIEGVPKYLKFKSNIPFYGGGEGDVFVEEEKTGKLAGKKFVLTGSRTLSQIIIENSGVIVDSVSTNIEAVIASGKSLGKKTGKILAAEKLGKPVLSEEEFRERYQL